MCIRDRCGAAGDQGFACSKIADGAVQLSGVDAGNTGNPEFQHDLGQGGGAAEVGGFKMCIRDRPMAERGAASALKSAVKM